MKYILIITFISFYHLMATGRVQESHCEIWYAPSDADTLHNPGSCDEGVLKAGEKIYMKVCWTCHGFDGSGNGPSAAKMKIKPASLTSEIVQKQSDGALFWKISTGRGEMSSFRQTLSSKQRWQMVCYIRFLHSTHTSGR